MFTDTKMFYEEVVRVPMRQLSIQVTTCKSKPLEVKVHLKHGALVHTNSKL